jgi:UDP-N-acetylmuramoyl-tripeptide--D-alanyl-D-alanine ligase
VREDQEIVTFGPGGDVDRLPGSIEIDFPSRHMETNALAALAAVRAIGVEPEGRIELEISALRGERIALDDGVVVINDCYNANPMSMRAALADLAESATGRRVAVLGDMLELGPDERRFHAELGVQARDAGVDVLVTVGDLAVHAGPAWGGEDFVAVDNAAQAAERLAGLLEPGDTVLVKGSRGVGLELVAERLVAEGGGQR